MSAAMAVKMGKNAAASAILEAPSQKRRRVLTRMWTIKKRANGGSIRRNGHQLHSRRNRYREGGHSHHTRPFIIIRRTIDHPFYCRTQLGLFIISLNQISSPCLRLRCFPLRGRPCLWSVQEMIRRQVLEFKASNPKLISCELSNPFILYIVFALWGSFFPM